MQFIGRVQRGGAAYPRAVVVHLAVRLRLVDAFNLAAAHAVNEGDVADRPLVPYQFSALAQCSARRRMNLGRVITSGYTP